jgi:DNA-binding transcriptional LysR family regulator
MPDWTRGDRDVFALFAPHRMLSPKVRAFVDFLREEVTIDRSQD